MQGPYRRRHFVELTDWFKKMQGVVTTVSTGMIRGMFEFSQYLYLKSKTSDDLDDENEWAA